MKTICLLLLQTILGGVFGIYGQDTGSVLKTNRATKILEHIKNPSKDHILVVSHRGDWRYAPENSLLAIQKCIDIGVDIIELDFRLTKDGYLVAMHDETVTRTTNGKGKVSELTLKELKKLRLRNGCGVRYSRQQIPTLEEVMNLVKGKVMVNLDKTESKWVKEAYKVLRKTETVNQAIFKGNDSYEIMHKKYGNLMDSILYMPKLWYKNNDVKKFRESYENAINPFYYEVLFDSEQSETFTMIKNLKKDGDGFLAIALWDELCAGRTDELAVLKGPEEAWGWLVNHGANAIMTDRPKELLKYLSKKGLRN